MAINRMKEVRYHAVSIKWNSDTCSSVCTFLYTVHITCTVVNDSCVNVLVDADLKDVDS